MDSVTPKRTNLKPKALLFLLLGSLIAFGILFLIYLAREKIDSDYSQRIASVGTKFVTAEEMYTEAVKSLSTRSPVSNQDIDKIKGLYSDVDADLKAIKGNIFVEKESSNTIDEILETIEKRNQQLKEVQNISKILEDESIILQRLRDASSCLEKVNFKNEEDQVMPGE